MPYRKATWVMFVAVVVAIVCNVVLLFDKDSPATRDSWQLPMFAAMLWTTALWLKEEGGTHDAAKVMYRTGLAPPPPPSISLA